MSIKILLAEDHTIVREGLRRLLKEEADFELVAETGTGDAAVQLARELLPDVVVMDISMPGMNGIDATRLIVDAGIGVRVLALSMESDRRFVVEVIKAGADGYLSKDSSFAELAMAIRTIAAGETYLGSRIMNLVVKEFLQCIPQEMSLTYEKLSVREREILQLFVDGRTAKEIAYTFGVCLKTVENQRHSIMKKLKLYSIAELTKYAIREGLASLN